MRQVIVALAMVTAGLWAADIGAAQITKTPLSVPGQMNLQGYLTDASGNPVNGAKSMLFKVYRDGGLQWQEARTCTVQTGLFAVTLGRLVPIPASVFDPAGTTCELDVNVEGEPLVPRVAITSNAFAFHSVKSDSAAAIARPLTPGVAATEIADGAVTMPKINQSGATTGQVIRWSGSAWAPGNSGGVSGDSFIKNQSSSAQNADFWISGGGAAQQFMGTSATADVPGIWGSGGTYAPGVYADANNTGWAAVMGANANSAGTGVTGAGNDEQPQALADGSGGAFTGAANGVFGMAASTSLLPITGGYFLASGPPDNYSYVAMWDDQGHGYRCYGNGECTQGAMTRDGRRMVFSLQSPEPGIEDLGHGRLMDGCCRIDLDPLLLDCVSITDAAPLDVFVQLNGDCNGVYVVTDARGFDVRELKGGKSNVPFTWRVVASTRDRDNVRFPRAPEPRDVRTVDSHVHELGRQ